MSRQLAISATLSIFAMSVFVLFGADVSGDPFDPPGPAIGAPATLLLPSVPFSASELLRP